MIFEVDIDYKVIYLVGNNVIRFIGFNAELLSYDITNIDTYGSIKFYYLDSHILISC